MLCSGEPKKEISSAYARLGTFFETSTWSASSETLHSAVEECGDVVPHVPQTTPNGSLYLTVKKEELTLYCFNPNEFIPRGFPTDAKVYFTKKFPISPSIEKKLASAIADKRISGEQERESVRVALGYSESLKTAEKIKKQKPISWMELYNLMKLARLGEAQAAEALKSPNILTLLQEAPPENLLKKMLPNLVFFFPEEGIEFIKELYTCSVKKIYREGYHYEDFDGLSHEGMIKLKSIRKIASETAKIIFEEAINENSADGALTIFFLEEVLQKPNPENKEVITGMLAGWNQLPENLREVISSFFSTEYDFSVAHTSYHNTFKEDHPFINLLGFMSARSMRKDAKEMLFDLVLEEISNGVNSALGYCMDVLVANKDRQMKKWIEELLVGKYSSLSDEALLVVVQTMFESDRSFSIFRNFLSGKKKIRLSPDQKQKAFNLTALVLKGLKPAEFDKNLPILGKMTTVTDSLGEGYTIPSYDFIRKIRVEDDYNTFVLNLLKRGMFETVQAYFSNLPLLAQKEQASGQSFNNAARFVFLESVNYEQMHSFLISFIDTEDTQLGLLILKVTVYEFSQRNGNRGLFRDKLKGASEKGLPGVHLGVVHKAIINEVSEGKYVDPVNKLHILLAALKQGYSYAQEQISAGLQDENLSVRHLYLVFFYERYSSLLLKGQNNASPVFRFFEEQFSKIDLTYMVNYAHELLGELSSAPSEKEVRKIGLIELMAAFNEYPVSMFTNLGNKSGLEALEGLARSVESWPPICGPADKKKFSFERWFTGEVEKAVGAYGGLVTMNIEKAQMFGLNEQVFSYLFILENMILSGHPLSGKFVESIKFLALYPATSQSAISTLKAIAKGRNRESLFALSALSKLSKMSKKREKALKEPYEYLKDYQIREIDRFLKSFNPSGLIEADCDPTDGYLWRFLVADLHKLGNPYAYATMRDYLLDAYKEHIGKLYDAETFDEINKKSAVLLGDLMGLGKSVLEGPDAQKNIQNLAQELTSIINENKDLFEDVLSELGRFQDDSGVLNLLGKFGLSGAILNESSMTGLLAEAAKNNEDAYMALSVLAQANIDGFSERARRKMMSLPRENKAAERIFEIFANNQRDWVDYYNSRRKSQSEYDLLGD